MTSLKKEVKRLPLCEDSLKKHTLKIEMGKIWIKLQVTSIKLHKKNKTNGTKQAS